MPAFNGSAWRADGVVDTGVALSQFRFLLTVRAADPHTSTMTQPKRPRDPNQLAKMITDLTTRTTTEIDPDAGKDAKAVANGRRGGLRGGVARAANLSSRRRSEIAKKAAAVRWSNRNK
jgi:hypothetical protein